MSDELRIGLALSGGGSRAIAFHLGCMRALHDRGILPKVSVVSSVSGGSVIAALWAYSDHDFDKFEQEVTHILSIGLTKGILRQSLLSLETLKILATILTSGLFAVIGNLFSLIGFLLSRAGWRQNPLLQFASWISKTFRRYASRSTAFERHLRTAVFGDVRLDQVKRANLDVVINASELRTGTAFRFGSRISSCWRLGTIRGKAPNVSQAVAASAAFPVLLPAFDMVMEFDKNGVIAKKRVLISDGGVYENLGISCLLPGRAAPYAMNVFDCDFIISCDAGHGIPAGNDLVYNWGGRMNSCVNSIFRHSNNQGYGLLHILAETGKIKGFLLLYLGQQDASLPHRPSDLVSRDKIASFPTDFGAMSASDIEMLSKRGEQLTGLLVEHYHPSL